MLNQFGALISKARKGRKLRLREVADQLGMDAPMLSKIEHGKRTAKKDQIHQFAQILGLSPKDLTTTWLADQLIELIRDDPNGLNALQLVEEEIKGYAVKQQK